MYLAAKARQAWLVCLEREVHQVRPVLKVAGVVQDRLVVKGPRANKVKEVFKALEAPLAPLVNQGVKEMLARQVNLVKLEQLA